MKYVVKKSVKDLDYYKGKLKEFLNKKYSSTIKKSILTDEEFMLKARGYAAGTIRDWRGKKYKKMGDGKWVRYYQQTGTRGAKQALRNTINKINKAESMDELVKIVRDNMKRFHDENGKPSSIVKELFSAVRGTEAGKKVKKETKSEKLYPDFHREKKEFNIKSKGRKYFKGSKSGSSYQEKIAINEFTENIKVGDNISGVFAVEDKSNKYGTNKTYYYLGEQGNKELDNDEIDRWMGYVRDAAKKGYIYNKGIAKLDQLGVYKIDSVKNELDTILESVKEKIKIGKIEQYLGYLKESANKGSINNSAVNKLKSLNIGNYKKYKDEYDIIMSQVKSSDTIKKRALFPIYGEIPSMNKPVEYAGNIVVFEGSGKTFKINENHPSVYGSHLLGHEGGQGAYFYYRQASPEEKEQYNTEAKITEKKRTNIIKHDKAIREIREYIYENGDKPSEIDSIDGEVIHDTHNIYGGGESIIKDKNGNIWYIEGNGADGDNFALNNYRGNIAIKVKENTTINNAVSSIKDLKNKIDEMDNFWD